jgi:predicted TIM-barrel fold metal-dependent hydrolase
MLALYHTGIAGFGTLGFPRMRPEYLMTIAAKFTNLQIICAHFGNPWYAEAAEVVRWCKNVHCDITGSTLTKLEGKLGQIKDYLWWEGPSQHSAPDTVYAFEKLVFGTDEPPERLDNMLSRYEDMFNACQVPEETRRRVYGGTLAKLLGIQVRT